ncbi:PEP-utilizing enzyme [Aestuariimicrobium soli]|uniref:PEP-utilizing enzyme n=1 Tax=Aestuariimicrobium soli TaxID=2035834 RepID=UPI003EB77E97
MGPLLMGGKAAGLRLLRAAGEPVPDWVEIAPGEPVPELPAVGEGGRWAVRSSADDEDGLATKAGHYLTELDVPTDRVADAVERVRASGATASMTVVVQRMVDADLSGVVFSADPAGVLDLVVVSAGEGPGAVVAGDRPTTTVTTSTADGRAWRHREVGGPDVPDDLVRQLVAAAGRVERAAGHPVDLEWAWADGQLWLLQCRRITTLPAGQTITLDTSNIVENYPGLVLPLTASFVPLTYRLVFTRLAERLADDPALVEEFAPVLAGMAVANTGRLWYRLENWYSVMALMPFADRYTAIWRRSLGVPEGGNRPAVRVTARQRARVVVNLVRSLHRTPRELTDLSRRVRETSAWARPLIARATNLADLRSIFDRLVDDLVSHWDLTLLNDVRAFVLPSGAGTNGGGAVAEVESLRPALAWSDLARSAPDLSWITTREQAAEWLAGSDDFRDRVRAVVDEFGDRGLAELKLESRTPRTDSWLVVQALTAFGQGRVRPPRPRGSGGWLQAKADEAIRLRESSRLDRARVHGLVRDIALRAGVLLAESGAVEAPDDVFWLTIDELFDPPADAAARVASRKHDQHDFAGLPDLRRLTFVGEPFDLHRPVDLHRLVDQGAPRPSGEATLAGELRGSGVSSGSGRGVVRVVHDPADLLDADVDGAVLVTATTDPGWIYVLPRCAAVVAERGSALSHTAIVARELGVPVVVGVTDATRLLAEGSPVEVDGSRGIVRRVES